MTRTDVDPGVTVSGGGSAAVETPAMLRAASALEAVRHDIAGVARGVDALQAGPAWAALDPAVRGRAHDAAAAARALCSRAEALAGSTAQALRSAALEYGAEERTVTGAVETAWAAGAALDGVALRVAATSGGPVAALLVGGWESEAVLAPIAVETAAHTLTTGRFEPQLDPVALTMLRLDLSSIDDLLRGFFGIETAGDLTHDDPASPLGTATVASALAAVFTLLGNPDRRVQVRRSGVVEPVARPTTLEELADRLPPGGPNRPQVRIERYADADGGTRWIVYSSGTVTFSPESGDEPFDMTANLLGVADRPSQSSEALTAAMRDAGIRPDQPVLLVGHSQGALNVERVAEHGGFDVAGVVTLGGPTGQIVPPKGVPVLAVEHDEDPVPVLGGMAATGAPGLGRVLVRRRLYARTPPPGACDPFSSHADEAYARTLGMAERSGAPQVRRFTGRIRPFLEGGDGSLERWRASRPTGRRLKPNPPSGCAVRAR